MYQESQYGDVALSFGGEVHLLLDGELDIASGPRLLLLTRAALSSGEPVAVLDLSSVTFIDHAGLHYVLAARSLLLAAGLRVVVPTPSGAVALLMDQTSTTEHLAPHPRGWA